MTPRSLIIGTLLALFISGFAYFNDQVVQSTYLIGNFLPIGVFGVVLLLLLLGNPLLGRLKPGLGLDPKREITVIAALGLAACAWPGSNLYRSFTGILAMPNQLVNFESSWQANELMSYVPGGSPELAPGQVRDWGALARAVAGAEAGAAGPLGRLKAEMSESERALFARAAEKTAVPGGLARQMTGVLNRLLAEEALFDEGAAPSGEGGASGVVAANRGVLAAALPDLLLPPPEGGPVLLEVEGREDRVLAPLLEGRAAEERLSLTDLPWADWWPTLRIWVTVLLGMGLATVCLALIVHRQWTRNELLSYPLVRFVEELLETREGGVAPKILSNRLFWVGFALVFLLHVQNGLATWFPALPDIPLRVDFTPLATLFPNARSVPFSIIGLFSFSIIPSVVAFAFFLDSRISLSLGLANLFWVVFGALLVGRGVAMGYAYLDAENTNMVRFGAYLGFAAMILYTGRRYYKEVAQGALGLGDPAAVPAYARWAGRGLLAGSALALAGLSLAGLSFGWALLLVLSVLLIFLVLGRIVAETGAFFLQAYWMPVGVFTALFGFEAIGPTEFLVLALASTILVGDPRTTLMPFILNGLRLGQSASTNRRDGGSGRLGLALLGIVALSFVVAGAVTFWWQYNHGFSDDTWANRSLPSMSFASLDRHVGDLSAKGMLSEVTAATAPGGGGGFALPSFDAASLQWTGLGVGLVVLVAVARLRLPWWPLHPVLFLVWGTYPLSLFGGSFLIGWMIKQGVVKTVGARGFHLLKPLMVGFVSAEVLAALAWAGVSVIYYLNTGLPPQIYRVFPE